VTVEFIMDHDLDSEKLLETSSSGSDDVGQSYIREDYQKKHRRHICTPFLVFLLMFSNLVWFWHFQHVQSHSLSDSVSYYGALDQIRVPFSHDWVGLVDFEEGNKSHYADEKWLGQTPPGGGIIALTKSFAAENNLPPSSIAPEDPNKMIYLVAGYHQLHCMEMVRVTVYQLNGTSTSTEPIAWDHILHCIEVVRMSLKCFLDTTLIPLAEEWPGVPNGQEHMCRNYEALYKWTAERKHAEPVDPCIKTRTCEGPRAQGHDHTHR